MASSVGVMRQISALKNARSTRESPQSWELWSTHIEGACGELAVAKWLGLYWDGSIGRFKSAPDLGNLEVRTSRHPAGHLMVYPRDDDDRMYVLVVGVAPTYRVVGGISGRGAKQSQWWKADARVPTWWVPQSALEPVGGGVG